MVFICVLIFMVFGWYANRVRGMTKKPWFLPSKIAVYVAMTCLYLGGQFLVDFDKMVAAGTFLGFALSVSEWILHTPLVLLLLLCFSFGWGKYYPHGSNIIKGEYLWKEKEFPPADWLANIVVGKWDEPMPTKWVRNWQMVAMSGRFGFTFGFILFPLLAAINESWLTLLGIPCSFLAGYLYKLAFKPFTEDSIGKAENWVGALLGLLLALPLFN